jgi:hypothetical protein
LPRIGSTFNDIGFGILDYFASGGVAVTSGLNSGFSLAADIEKTANGSTGSAAAYPKEGVVLAAPPMSTPPNTRPLNLIPGSGISGTARWMAVAATQAVTPLTTATLPPLSAARFNGIYTGTAAGTCTAATPAGVVTQNSSVPIALAISNGVLTVTDGGSGSGPVNAEGQLLTMGAISVNGAACTAGGRFWEDGAGRAGGSGSTKCTGAGFTCAGTWNAARK